MILSFKDLSHWFVFEKKNPNMPVATVKDLVVDPDTGKVCAYWVAGIAGLQVLLPSDVLAWVGKKILVESESFFQNPEKMPRLKNVFEREVSLIGAAVFSENKKIGTVKNLFFDTEKQLVVSFVYKKHWFAAKKSVLRYQVVCITEKGITVDLNRKESDFLEVNTDVFAAAVPSVSKSKEVLDI